MSKLHYRMVHTGLLFIMWVWFVIKKCAETLLDKLEDQLAHLGNSSKLLYK